MNRCGRLLIVRRHHIALLAEQFLPLGLGDNQRVVAGRNLTRVHLRLEVVLAFGRDLGVPRAGVTATREFVVEDCRAGVTRSFVVLGRLEVLLRLLIPDRELGLRQPLGHRGIVGQFGHRSLGNVHQVHRFGALAAVVDRAAGGVVLRLDGVGDGLRPQRAILVEFDQLAEEVVGLVEVAANVVHVTAPEERLVRERAAEIVRVNVLERFQRPTLLHEERPRVIQRVGQVRMPVQDALLALAGGEFLAEVVQPVVANLEDLHARFLAVSPGGEVHEEAVVGVDGFGVVASTAARFGLHPPGLLGERGAVARVVREFLEERLRLGILGVVEQFLSLRHLLVGARIVVLGGERPPVGGFRFDIVHGLATGREPEARHGRGQQLHPSRSAVSHDPLPLSGRGQKPEDRGTEDRGESVVCLGLFSGIWPLTSVL